jgi:hypothetical protein
MISWADLAPWAGFAVSIAALLRAHFNGRSKELDQRIGIIIADMALSKDKITRIEGELKHLPDKDSTHRLELALGKVEAEMGKLAAQVKPIAHMADRMQEAMLEKVMS